MHRGRSAPRSGEKPYPSPRGSPCQLPFSGLENQTTKLASDREISQSTAAFSPPSFVVKSAQGETFVLHKTLALFFNSQFITGFDRKYWNAVRRCAVVEVDLSSLFCLSKDRWEKKNTFISSGSVLVEGPVCHFCLPHFLAHHPRFPWNVQPQITKWNALVPRIKLVRGHF